MHSVFGRVPVLLVAAIMVITSRSCCSLFDQLKWLKASVSSLTNSFQLPITCSTCRPYPVCPSKGPIPCTDDLTEASKVRKFPSPLYPNLYECEKGCLNSESYSKDRYRAKEVCQVEPMNEEAIQREIWTYGSVTAKFDIFKSFLSFGKGVYYQDSTEKFGVQAIKLVSLRKSRNDGPDSWLRMKQSIAKITIETLISATVRPSF